MLDNSESLALITKYLNNPANQELQSALHEFRSAAVENDQYFLEVERIYLKSSLAGRLAGIDQKRSVRKFKQHLTRNVQTRTSYLVWFSRIAASILIIASSYWLYHEHTKIDYIVKTTSKNQIDSVTLKDGSVIILAENSELKYPINFGSAKREIMLLRGKGFFKIAKDPQHPFKVIINKSDVEVLGTTFNIRLGKNTIDLSVKTGRVLFTPYKDGAASMLTNGQAISYNIDKKEFLTKNAQNGDAWLTKELIFVDTPLEDVCEQLSDYYNIRIKLQDKKQGSEKLNAKFINQSLDDVLLVLNETYNIKINKEKNQINLITPNQIK